MSGPAQQAWVHEPEYRGDPTDTDYKRFGYDPSVEDLSFERALARMGLPTDPETLNTVSNTFEGAISVSYVPAGQPWYHTGVFAEQPTAGGESSEPYSYEWTPTLTPTMPSARLYAGADFLNGTAEREIVGAAWTQLETDWTEGEEIRQTLTGFYADEDYNTSLTPGSIQDITGDPLVFHGGTLTIDSTTQKELSSGSLSIQNGGRPRRGMEAFIRGAATGTFETSFDIEKVKDGDDQQILAYGDAGGAQAQPTTAPTASFAFTTPGVNSLTYDLTRVTPENFSWNDVLDRDEDLLESISYVADEIVATAETDSSEAL